MPVLPETASPEELENTGLSLINEGNVRDGLRYILRAAKKYEDENRKEDAARLYRYFGYYFLKKLNMKDRARPPLIKSAYLYIDLIDDEFSKPEIDVIKLNEYCSNALSVFVAIGDEENLKKYAKEFAGIYKDLGESYMEEGNVEKAVLAYEDAFRYYKLAGDRESYRSIADLLVSAYGKLAEERLDRNDHEGAAEAFYQLASFIIEIFGYSDNYMEMMDTVARNYEKASKIAYSKGNLDKTTTNLLKAQYAYMLAGNNARSKLIGVNNVRMLYQVIDLYRRMGNEKTVVRKMMEMVESLLGIGREKDAIKVYENVMNTNADLGYKVEIRLALLKTKGAEKKSTEIMKVVGEVEYYMRRRNTARAMEIVDGYIRSIDDFKETLNLIQRAEGFYSD